MRRTKKQDNGFTLLESAVVLGIMMVMMSFAIFKTTSIMPNYKADAAQDVVVSALRQARQLAITERRDVQVWFDQGFSGPGPVQHINYQVVTILGDQPQPQVSVGLPLGTQFVLEGVPDTPMGFGANAAIYIGSNGDGWRRPANHEVPFHRLVHGFSLFSPERHDLCRNSQSGFHCSRGDHFWWHWARKAVQLDRHDVGGVRR